MEFLKFDPSAGFGMSGSLVSLRENCCAADVYFNARSIRAGGFLTE